MKSKTLIFIFVFLLFIPISFAADAYKPYIHKTTVPDHPKIVLYGQYSTELFPGAATYGLEIRVPKGTNGLEPSIKLSYNSQATAQRPSVLGAGWSMSQNYIQRDVNSTVNSFSDDKYVVLLDGVPYELVYNPSEGRWYTEVDYHFKIQNLSGSPNSKNTYWLVTKKDGTKYRFGYNNDSELLSDTGAFVTKWSLDQVEDTHGNKYIILTLKIQTQMMLAQYILTKSTTTMMKQGKSNLAMNLLQGLTNVECLSRELAYLKAEG